LKKKGKIVMLGPHSEALVDVLDFSLPQLKRYALHSQLDAHWASEMHFDGLWLEGGQQHLEHGC